MGSSPPEHLMTKTLILFLLLLATLGCASQSEVDALKKQIENMKTERAQQRELLKKAVEDAQDALGACKISNANDFDKAWEANSTPVKGKLGTREGNRELLHHLHEEQHTADAECQRDYENALQKAKLLYGTMN
jgi:polyhydroxyalkanoate synthesis regulator phasin